MCKIIKKSLLILLLITLFWVPAYGKTTESENSIIIIPVGAPNYAVGFFQILIDSYNEIDAAWLRDLNIRYDQYSPIYSSTFVDWNEVEAGNYKIALFLFGELSLDPSVMLTDKLNIDQLIEDLRNQILFCQQNDIIVVGIPFYIESQSAKAFVHWDLNYNNRIIKELTPLMDQIWVIYDFNDCNDFNNSLLKTAEKNNIYIDHLKGASNRVLRDSFKTISSELNYRIKSLHE